jgi:hypothetical protein
MIEEFEAPDMSVNTRAMELIRVWLIDGKLTCVIKPTISLGRAKL